MTLSKATASGPATSENRYLGSGTVKQQMRVGELPICLEWHST